MKLRSNPVVVAVLLALAGGVTAAAEAPTAVEDAVQLMDQGRYEKALDRLNSHLESAPQDAEARFTRGLVLVRMNRAEEAIRVFTELTRDYPQLPEPYNNLAVLYAQQGDYEKARDALEAALASHPSYVTAHENLGDIYAALATAAYNRAAALDAGNSGVRAKLELLNQLDSLADSGATIVARATSAAPPAPEGEAAAPAQLAPADAAAIRQLVQEWAAAWSARDVERYLSFYGPAFAPEGGASRQVWEAQRRARISKPKEIRVTVGEVALEALGDGRVRATFEQAYASDLLTNTSTKVLELRNDNGWSIVREFSR